MPKTESVQSLGLVEGAAGPTDLVYELISLHVVVQKELTQPGVVCCHLGQTTTFLVPWDS